MVQVRPWLWIGRYRETLNRSLLLQHGVGAMLLLAEPVHHQGITSLYLNVDDGVPLSAEMLERGTQFIMQQADASQVVLSACGAGISRSVTFALAALCHAERLSPLEAYREVCRVHPEAMPHMALWDSLYAYLERPERFGDLWQEIIRIQKESNHESHP